MSTPLDKVDAAIALLQEYRAAVLAQIIRVTPGQSLQAAIDAAPPRSTLVLDDGASYAGALVINKPLTLQAATLPPSGQRGPTLMAAWLKGATGADSVTVTGDDVHLIGIGVSSDDPTRQLVAVTGQRFSFDRAMALGSAVKGQHRGLMLNGEGALIVDSYIDECWGIGRDCQAIAGWDGSKDIQIDNCYLGGGAQSVMFGGADSSSPSRVPSDINITRSTLSKNPAWFGLGAQIKTALELKCVSGFTMADCVLEYAGTAQGQGAYLFVLTVRNQDGSAPWSTIESVVIERCLARYGAGAINLLGTDNVHPSATMAGVMFKNCLWSDLDPSKYPGAAGRGIQFDGAPSNVTVQDCEIRGQNMAAQMYLLRAGGLPKHLTLKNIKLPASSYGMKIDAGGMGAAAWQALMPDAVIDLKPTDVGGSGYPAV